MKELEDLIERSYSTYKSRLVASERLAFRNNAWNVSLVALSSSLVIASIGLLTDPKMYGSQSATLLVSLSILALSVSLTVTGQNYGGRSRDMFTNYRRIQHLSVDAELLKATPNYSISDVILLAQRYQSLLDESENHSASDYIKCLKLAKQKKGTNSPHPGPITNTKSRSRSLLLAGSILNWLPFAFLIVPFTLLIPFANWIMSGK